MRIDRGRLVIAILIPVAAVTCIGLVFAVIARDRAERSSAGVAAERYSSAPVPMPSPTPSETATPSRELITVIGDDRLLSRSGAGAWPRVLARQEDAEVVQKISAGYVAADGAAADSIPQLARGVDPESTVVVLAGGAADRADPTGELRTAVDAALTAVERRAPSARVLVVGPVWTGAGTPPADLLSVGNVLRAAAGAQQATWLDPISRDWFASTSGATETDDVTATAAAQSVIADRVQQGLQDAG